MYNKFYLSSDGTASGKTLKTVAVSKLKAGGSVQTALGTFQTCGADGWAKHLSQDLEAASGYAQVASERMPL